MIVATPVAKPIAKPVKIDSQVKKSIAFAKKTMGRVQRSLRKMNPEEFRKNKRRCLFCNILHAISSNGDIHDHYCLGGEKYSKVHRQIQPNHTEQINVQTNVQTNDADEFKKPRSFLKDRCQCMYCTKSVAITQGGRLNEHTCKGSVKYSTVRVINELIHKSTLLGTLDIQKIAL